MRVASPHPRNGDAPQRVSREMRSHPTTQPRRASRTGDVPRLLDARVTASPRPRTPSPAGEYAEYACRAGEDPSPADLTSMYDLRVPETEDEPTVTKPTVLALVEFPCPVCHAPVVAEHHRGHLRIPDHAVQSPVYPHGYGGPPFRVTCPISGMPIVEFCTGAHRPPACSDPAGCIAADRVDGEVSHEDRGLAEEPAGAVVTAESRWPEDEHAAEWPTYHDQAG